MKNKIILQFLKQAVFQGWQGFVLNREKTAKAFKLPFPQDTQHSNIKRNVATFSAL